MLRQSTAWSASKGSRWTTLLAGLAVVCASSSFAQNNASNQGTQVQGGVQDFDER